MKMNWGSFNVLGFVVFKGEENSRQVKAKRRSAKHTQLDRRRRRRRRRETFPLFTMLNFIFTSNSAQRNVEKAKVRL